MGVEPMKSVSMWKLIPLLVGVYLYSLNQMVWIKYFRLSGILFSAVTLLMTTPLFLSLNLGGQWYGWVTPILVTLMCGSGVNPLRGIASVFEVLIVVMLYALQLWAVCR